MSSSSTEFKFRVKWDIPNQRSLIKPSYQHRISLYRATQPFTFLHGAIIPLGRQTPAQLVSSESISVPATNSLLNYKRNYVAILTAMQIPQRIQSQILQKIADDVRDGFRCCCFQVQIMAVKFEEYDIDAAAAMAEGEIMQHGIRTTPASKQSIDALERLVFDGLETSSMDCAICMDGIKAGVKAVRMPCSHVYHDNCIVEWLLTSHRCPLCRYDMPCDV